MAKAKKELPLAPLERLIRDSGAKRVSKSAAKALSEILADYAYDLSAEAARLASHAGRKTVVDADVKMARRRMG